MATALPLSRPHAPPATSGVGPACALLALASAAALVAGWVRLTFSIVTVFLFAGPPNWAGARLFLGPLPAPAARPGRQAPGLLPRLVRGRRRADRRVRRHPRTGGTDRLGPRRLADRRGRLEHRPGRLGAAAGADAQPDQPAARLGLGAA